MRLWPLLGGEAGGKVVNNCLHPLFNWSICSCFLSCLLQDTTLLQSVADLKSPGRSVNAYHFLESPSVSSDVQNQQQNLSRSFTSLMLSPETSPVLHYTYITQGSKWMCQRVTVPFFASLELGLVGFKSSLWQFTGWCSRPVWRNRVIKLWP